MLTIHHLNNSRSQRILWLLEELEIPYQLTCYERDPHTLLAPPELKKIHPLGKSPVLTDGKHTVAESAAIIEYILDNYGAPSHETQTDGQSLRPDASSDEFLQYRYWMHYAEGSAMPPLMLKLVFNELPRQGPVLARPILKAVSSIVGKQYIDAQLKTHFDYWEQVLSQQSYFVGDTFTAADIQMSFPLESATVTGITREQYPNMFNLLERLHSRPAYQRALERGGPFSITGR